MNRSPRRTRERLPKGETSERWQVGSKQTCMQVKALSSNWTIFLVNAFSNRIFWVNLVELDIGPVP